MILVTRLNGQLIALNPDLIERAEASPDTVVSLVSGAKHIIRESLSDLAQLMTAHRADILRASTVGAMPEHQAPTLRVISDKQRGGWDT